MSEGSPPTDASTVRTVPEWLRPGAERWPDRPAIIGIDGDRAIAHAELDALVRACAAQVRDWGIERSGVVVAGLPDGRRR